MSSYFPISLANLRVKMAVSYICSSLVMGKVEHLFGRLLAICNSFFMKCQSLNILLLDCSFFTY